MRPTVVTAAPYQQGAVSPARAAALPATSGPLCVFVAADLYHQKVNLELVFYGAPSTAQLRQEVQRVFDAESSVLCPPRAAPHVFALRKLQVFEQESWRDIATAGPSPTDPVALADGAQLYAFQTGPGHQESQQQIPPPRRPSPTQHQSHAVDRQPQPHPQPQPQPRPARVHAAQGVQPSASSPLPSHHRLNATVEIGSTTMHGSLDRFSARVPEPVPTARGAVPTVSPPRLRASVSDSGLVKTPPMRAGAQPQPQAPGLPPSPTRESVAYYDPVAMATSTGSTPAAGSTPAPAAATPSAALVHDISPGPRRVVAQSGQVQHQQVLSWADQRGPQIPVLQEQQAHVTAAATAAAAAGVQAVGRRPSPEPVPSRPAFNDRGPLYAGVVETRPTLSPRSAAQLSFEASTPAGVPPTSSSGVAQGYADDPSSRMTAMAMANQPAMGTADMVAAPTPSTPASTRPSAARPETTVVPVWQEVDLPYGRTAPPTDSAAADAKARYVFGEFDVDGDGFVSGAEWAAGLEAVHIGLPHTAPDDILRRCDADNDGALSLDEFLVFSGLYPTVYDAILNRLLDAAAARGLSDAISMHRAVLARARDESNDLGRRADGRRTEVSRAAMAQRDAMAAVEAVRQKESDLREVLTRCAAELEETGARSANADAAVRAAEKDAVAARDTVDARNASVRAAEANQAQAVAAVDTAVAEEEQLRAQLAAAIERRQQAEAGAQAAAVVAHQAANSARAAQVNAENAQTAVQESKDAAAALEREQLLRVERQRELDALFAAAVTETHHVEDDARAAADATAAAAKAENELTVALQQAQQTAAHAQDRAAATEQELAAFQERRQAMAVQERPLVLQELRTRHDRDALDREAALRRHSAAAYCSTGTAPSDQASVPRS